MTDNESMGAIPPQPGKKRHEQKPGFPPASKLPSDGESIPPPSSPPAEPAAPKMLTPEEQMALYEKELKEDDWGHQPC
jgi:hypothetical protein